MVYFYDYYYNYVRALNQCTHKTVLKLNRVCVCVKAYECADAKTICKNKALVADRVRYSQRDRTIGRVEKPDVPLAILLT